MSTTLGCKDVGKDVRKKKDMVKKQDKGKIIIMDG